MPDECPRERRRAHRLAHRLIRFLKDGWEWKIRFMPLQSDIRVRRSIGFEMVVVGATLFDRYLICIDHSYEDFFTVLIHECLHGIYPFKEEADILALERLVRQHLTAHQAKHLMVWTANRLH